MELNFALEVGEVAESVTVSAESPLLDTATASMGSVIDSRRVAELPMAHGNPYLLLQLGVGVNFTGNLSLDQPYAPTHLASYTMDGARSLRSEITLDGVPNSAAGGSNQVLASYVPPADVVAEVKVQTAAFDASVGQTEGGVVNMTLKSGTSEPHGTLYYVKMTPQMTSNLFFSNRSGLPRTDFNHNRYGASALGPVVLPKIYNGKNRTFYMYGYEGIRSTTPRGTVLTVPTAKQREGDFSDLLRIGSNYQIYDPSTRRAAAGGRFQVDPLPGNIIPAARISPIAKKILGYYALPRAAGTVDGRNNLPLTDAVEPLTYYSHIARIDHNISEKHRVFGRANVYKRDSHYFNWFENASTGEWFQFLSRAASFDDVYVFSPSFILNVRYGYNRFIRAYDNNPEARGFDLTSLGLPASWNNAVDPSVRRFPYITISGYASTYNGMLWRPAETHSFIGAFDKVTGSHAMKFGGEYRVYRKTQYNCDNICTGTLSFGDTWTRGPFDNSTGAPIGPGLASLLLGLPTGGCIERRASLAEQSTVTSLYFQDDWKVTRKLTLSLGIRYEIEGPLTERFNRSVRGFDFNAALPIEAQVKANYAKNPTPEVPADQFRVRGGITFAGVNGQPRTLFARDANNIMPRFGFAYSATRRTVLRGGYGIFYGFLGVRRTDVNQTGFTQRTDVNPSLDGGLTFIATLANPFPDGVREPLGSSLGAMTYVGNGVSYFNLSPLAPYMQRWQFSVQRELPHRILIDAAYVGNRGTHIETSRALNAIPLQYLSRTGARDNDRINYLSANLSSPYYPLLPGTSRSGTLIARATLLTAYPHFTGVGATTNDGYSWYHSLQTKVEKRFSGGYTVQTAYTWSKLMEAAEFLNGADPRPYRSISDQDFPQRFSLSWIWELPFGRGRRLLASAPRAVNAIAGGWQVQGIFAAQSGQALGFGNALFYGNLKGITLPVDQRKPEQ